jgi:hypothetical protein
MMQKTPRFRTALVATLVCVLGFRGVEAQRLLVTAPGHEARLPEVLELKLSDVRRHVPYFENKNVENAATHERLVTQLYSTQGANSPDTLLIAVQVPASGRLLLQFVSKNNDMTPAPLVFGREAPERKDDFAWENEMVTYRVYGPALEATGEITSGIDVWSKRVPAFVIDSFYKHDAEGARTHNPALSYHKDDGVGLDSYQVGPSRGCGGTAVISGGKAWVSKNYTHLKVLSSGPVRFEFEMTYAPWNADGTEVTETKRITLDAGSHLNRIQSTFTFRGRATIAAAAGLAIHEGADFLTLENGHVLSVWDTPQDPSAGRIATGIVTDARNLAHAEQLEGQAWMIFDVHSDEPFTYYAGSGWSKSDMPTQQAWNKYLRTMRMQLGTPLNVSWKDEPASKKDQP